MSQLFASGGQSIGVSQGLVFVTVDEPVLIRYLLNTGRTDAEAETPIHWPPDKKS